MSMRKARINRLQTGVQGLDEVLGGGLPEYSFNLIAGSPGAGKTTLAHQIMFNLASAARPALYFTVLGEPPLKMLRYQQQFSFFDGAKVKGVIHFINLSDDTAAGDLDQVLARIVGEVEKHDAGLVFVDSFRSVALATQDGNKPPSRLQTFVQQLGMQMTSWQATTFLLGEYGVETESSPVVTVADGLIWLRQSVERNSMVRKLEIVKMRGQPTLAGLHTFRIGAGGISVFAPPHTAPQSAGETRVPVQARLSMGVPGLDAMMGGGLPCGYSLLVAGPSGSGKSILAAAFLAEGARNGETGLIAAFEQRPAQSRGPVMAELIESGRIGVINTREPGLSVDEIAVLIIAEIARLKVTRVVIDSLSGFELALAPTFRDDFRESLARMVAAIASTGATVLMISELEDRYNDLRFSPYGTAFLTDAIIVQRYVEIDSRLERVMAVVKVRASAHSKGLHLFEIDDEGIRIGTVRADHEGMLSGSPTRVADPRPRGDDAGLPVPTSEALPS